MTALATALPAPIHKREEFQATEPTRAPEKKAETETQLVAPRTIPPYGQRKSWKPRAQEDFGDGGAYPECFVAQYPLEMGRKKKTSSGNTLALQVDAEGKVRYDAIAQQGHRDGRFVQSQFKDLVPLAHRTDVKDSSMERPSEDEVLSTAARTAAALEKLSNAKIKAAQPKNVPNSQGAVSYMRYTPGQQGGDGEKQRIIKMVEVVEDPLEPPRFKHKKIPRGPPSPPAPILRSPPRKVTAQDQKDWMIPPCISNWKNNKGYTIPLDKRLAADGRGLQDIYVNDRFAQMAEALSVADRHAREEVRLRSQMLQRQAEKQKAEKEEALRDMAQRKREERAGIIPASNVGRLAPTSEEGPSGSGAGGARLPAALAAYGSDESDEEEKSEEEDDAAAKQREELRKERRKDREREMRMSNMGNEQRARQLARQQGRDISEKIALGLAKPTLSKESMVDSRLYNQESYSSGFADDDQYNLYDKPLFSGSSAAAAIYKPRGNVGEDDTAATEDGINKAMLNDRFGLGTAGRGRGFEGTDTNEVREGPVVFEKDTGDAFGISAFLDEAKKGAKRGLVQSGESSGDRKRAKVTDDDDD